MPTVLMLTSIASARNGERITSITTDVTFLVVLVFIRFVCSTHDARLFARYVHDFYNQCANGPPAVFRDFVVRFVARS